MAKREQWGGDEFIRRVKISRKRTKESSANRSTEWSIENGKKKKKKNRSGSRCNSLD